MRCLAVAALAITCRGVVLGAQVRVTRAAAVESAVARGPRAAIARADTLIGAAQVLAARQWENPSLGLTYSKSVPNYHEVLDLPLDLFGARSARIASAEASKTASLYRFSFERGAAALDADTTYTRALAARGHLRLSQRNAADADSLRRMAAVRRDAGDASELDVLLATLNAGQAANQAAADSLAYLSTLFDLQTVMGLDSDRVIVSPTDSLTPPTGTTDSSGTRFLPVAAAEQSVAAAELALRAERRSVFAPFSVQAGVEHGDPSERGLLPTVGISIPVPVLNRNRGAIALASAARGRAVAELAFVRLETRAAVARALRSRSLALEKLQRDRLLLENAGRIAAMSLTAYREGAQGLPAVLEAQRNARAIVSQYIDDVAEAWIALATLRLYNLPPTTR